MVGTRLGVLTLAFFLLTWTAPTALAHDHFDELPSCEEATDEDAVKIEEHYVRTVDETVEIWEEDNELEGLQVEECLDGEPIQENVVQPDKHKATLPGDAIESAEDAVDDAIGLALDAVDLVLDLAGTVVELVLEICNAVTGPGTQCSVF